jgi:hypothetical protein
VRLAATEAARQLPAELATDLLSRASHDSDRAVRRRVVELLSEIPLAGHPPAAIAVLRRMQNDTDAVVRSLATVALAQRLPRRVSARTAAEPVPSKNARQDAAAVTESAPSAGPPADKGAADRAPAEPAPGPGPGPGPGPMDNTGSAPAQATEGQRAGAIRKAIGSGLSALKNGEPAKAQRVLEKVNSTCARSHKEAALACAELADELSLALGRVYEAQSQWALAMREYDKLKSGVGSRPLTSQQRAEVSAALKRLSPKLGRVIIPKIVHKRCQESVVWMPPGTHTVNLRGSTQQVHVRAQETVKVGQCP